MTIQFCNGPYTVRLSRSRGWYCVECDQRAYVGSDGKWRHVEQKGSK